jgi:hypothetical protein
VHHFVSTRVLILASIIPLAWPVLGGSRSVSPIAPAGNAVGFAQSSACQPSWLPTFGQVPGVTDQLSGHPSEVYAVAVFDDGSGPAVYAGGRFTGAGGVESDFIAKWNGTRWSPLAGGGMNDQVLALAVFDDGNGAALYAGGEFTTAGGLPANRIAKWDGASWSPVGTGGMNKAVNVLAVFGGALHAGGEFATADGVSARGIARWNGTSWSGLGSGNQLSQGSFVMAMTVFDDGSGEALYAGGFIPSAGGSPVNQIAKWNGTSWSALGTGMNGHVRALAAFDDGSGLALHAGGAFTSAGGVPAKYVAKWNGATWSPLGSGMNGINPPVDALTVFDDGHGPALYAGGSFDFAGGVIAQGIAKWNGSSWSALGSGYGGPNVNAMIGFDDGSGPALYAAGYYAYAGGVLSNSIAKWNGSNWSSLGSGVSAAVLTMVVFDDGSGPALYAGGDFGDVGGVTAGHIAKWNGTSWSGLSGQQLSSRVSALAVFDDGSGSALYAATVVQFGSPDGIETKYVITKWNGTAWLGAVGVADGWINALTVFDDGTGPALYAGGLFADMNGVAANRIAKWDGTSWSELGIGMSGPSAAVHVLSIFDDGSGPALYAGGDFTSAGGVAANRIARWNGSTWSALGTGMTGAADVIFALTVFDDGGGRSLYAGGLFSAAGGVASSHIAKWDGMSWSSLDGGMNRFVGALRVFDDGNGRALYAGGGFTNAGGVAVHRIAKWNGSSWSALGGGMNDDVKALVVFEHDGVDALYAGGLFGSALDSGDSFIAKWGCDTVAPTLTCPASVLAFDELVGPAGTIVSFEVTVDDDHDPSPNVVSVPASGSYFPRGSTLVNCTATDAAGNQSTCQFTVTVVPKVRATATAK